MADEYTDVNKYAHEGGDTAPTTRKEIASRNQAADKLGEAAQKAKEAHAKADEEYQQAIASAEDAYRKSVPDPGVVSDSKSRR